MATEAQRARLRQLADLKRRQRAQDLAAANAGSREEAERISDHRQKVQYKCARCGSVFTDQSVYREHLREPHSSD